MVQCDLERVLNEVVDDALFCSALQVAVYGPLTHSSYCIGQLYEGCAVREDHLFSVHCATKPITALATGLLVDSYGLDLDAQVCDLLRGPGEAFGLTATIREVLNHEALIAEPSMLAVNLTPLYRRGDAVRQGITAQRGGYSEFSGQYLLSKVISTITGVPASDFVVTHLLRPLGLHGDIRFTFERSSFPEELERIGTYVTGLPLSPRPVIHDRSPHLACIDRIDLGGYASASSLAKLYAALGRVHRGESVEGLPSPVVLHDMLSHRRTAEYDPVLRRECSFAGGFMVQLADHGYGKMLGDDSFGHSGLSGSSLGFYDPDSGVSGALVANGIQHNPEDLIYYQSLIVGEIIRSARLGEP